MVAFFAADAAASPSGALFGSIPPDTELLFAQPAVGITSDDLARHVRSQGLQLAGEVREGGVRVRVPDGAAPAAVAARLAQSGAVRSVEADAVVRATGEPSDPLYAPGQHHYLHIIRAPEAWSKQSGDPQVVIAVVDTGVDWNHPDLAERIWVNTGERFMNGRDDDRNGCVDDIAGCNFVSLNTADPSCNYQEEPPHWRAFDDEGHGTFVAGIAAAAGNNDLGVAGIAWQARIMPVKVLDCTATGRISDAAAGIRYAARMGAHVINVSFGTLTDSPALADAVDYARRRGAVVVASAGNDGRRGITFPARYPGAISVAASGLERFDGIDYRATATFANFGGDVDFLAPGVDLLSTIPDALCGRNDWQCLEEGPYGFGTGSSFATPVVSGSLALMIAQYPRTSPEFLASVLRGARQPGSTPADARLLDIGRAFEHVLVGLAGPRGGHPAVEGAAPEASPTDQ